MVPPNNGGLVTAVAGWCEGRYAIHVQTYTSLPGLGYKFNSDAISTAR